MSSIVLVALALVITAILLARRWRRGPPRRTPHDAERDEFVVAIERRLESTRRVVGRVSLEPLPVDDERASKVGGRPFVPAGSEVPVDSGGRPMVLLAQINFADVGSMPGMPRGGLLQFFIAADTTYGRGRYTTKHGAADLLVQSGFRVVYLLPESIAAEPARIDIPSHARLPFDPRRPLRMRFKRADEVMPTSDHRFDAALGASLEELAEAFATAHGCDSEPLLDAVIDRFSGMGHKLGGYPGFTQDDPRDDPSLELLLQLDSRDGLMWGDAGIANFFIAPDDFAQARFDRVMYSWDCT